MGFCFVCRYDPHTANLNQRLTKSTILGLAALCHWPGRRFDVAGDNRHRPYHIYVREGRRIWGE
jgi:hypothetical protein